MQWWTFQALQNNNNKSSRTAATPADLHFFGWISTSHFEVLDYGSFQYVILMTL